MKYSAFVVSESTQGQYEGSVVELDTASLPEGEVLIKVEYSSVNFKDALSASGNKGVTRAYPHTPGIDAVGAVAESSSSEFIIGQKVLVVGYDLGMNTSGAFGEYIRVPQSWVMPLPESMSARESMAWGTAGFTSALCVEKLILNGVTPEQGTVIVSGGTGGVGSVAIKLLVKLGFDVHAITSKPSAEAYLMGLGVSKVVLLNDFIDESKKPLLRPLYSAGIDVAGGNVLSSILKTIDYQGVVACCGLVDSPTLNTTVLPFILRGVTLAGVDSVELPLDKKQTVWLKMSDEWRLDDIETNSNEITLPELSTALESVLQGKAVGRYILRHKA